MDCSRLTLSQMGLLHLHDNTQNKKGVITGREESNQIVNIIKLTVIHAQEDKPTVLNNQWRICGRAEVSAGQTIFTTLWHHLMASVMSYWGYDQIMQTHIQTLYFIHWIFTDSGVPVYLYELQHPPSFASSKRPTFVKADHGDDIAFVFGSCFWKGHININGKMYLPLTVAMHTYLHLEECLSFVAFLFW